MQNFGCKKTYVTVNIDVDEEGRVYPRYIRWKNGAVFQIDRILYQCRAVSEKVSRRRDSVYCAHPGKRILSLSGGQQMVRRGQDEGDVMGLHHGCHREEHLSQ